LSEDGSIWVSIDDNEVALLRVLMDEVFGRERFIACNVWQKRYSRENRGAIGDVHDYIVVYAINPDRFQETRNLIPMTEDQLKVYKNSNDDPRGRWRSISLTAQGFRPNQMYEIIGPSGRVHRPPEGSCWKVIQSEYRRLVEAGLIYFGKDGNGVPMRKRYLDEVEGVVPWTWWPSDEVGHTDESRKEVQSIFHTQTAFDTPKPSRLIERILQIATNPGDLVLDSFAGSGTTGHAVLKMNAAAPDADPRRFILVEMDEKIATDITRERVKRVAEGYTNAKGETVPGLGGGFRYVTLGDALFDETGQIRNTVRFAELARHVYFSETGEPLPKERISAKTPLLGVHHGRAIYLLFNGILSDKSVGGGNVLCRKTLEVIEELSASHGGIEATVVYGTSQRLSPARLKRGGITFKQTPYTIRVK